MVDIKTIVVLGAGLMGNGIAQVAIMAGYNVVMVDVKRTLKSCRGLGKIKNIA